MNEGVSVCVGLRLYYTTHTQDDNINYDAINRQTKGYDVEVGVMCIDLATFQHFTTRVLAKLARLARL